MSYIPMPGDVHPAYADRGAHVQDWLEATNDYAMQMLRPTPISVDFYALDADMPTSEPNRKTDVLDRRKVAAQAPWVGVPRFYWWWVAQDQIGRQIASEVVHSAIDNWRPCLVCEEVHCYCVHPYCDMGLREEWTA